MALNWEQLPWLPVTWEPMKVMLPTRLPPIFDLVGLLGVIMAAIMFFSAEWILLFMGAEADTMSHAVTYFRIVSVSMIFNTIQMSVNSMVRGAGDTKSPMSNNMTVNVINLVGNFLLINGIWFFPKLGVTGAALATAFSRLG
jgi:Na+-driven multidrug efflux pump